MQHSLNDLVKSKIKKCLLNKFLTAKKKCITVLFLQLAQLFWWTYMLKLVEFAETVSII